MDDGDFDRWTQVLGARMSRRSAGISASGIGVLTAFGLVDAIEAKKKKGKKKKKKKPSRCRTDGALCGDDGDCCSDFCGTSGNLSGACAGDRCLVIQGAPCTSECGCASTQLACRPSACGTENECCAIEGAFCTTTCRCCTGLKCEGSECVPA